MTTCTCRVNEHVVCRLLAVIGTMGLVALGGSLAAKRAKNGSLSLPTMGTSVPDSRRETDSLRVQPLQKKITDVPDGPKEVDRISE